MHLCGHSSIKFLWSCDTRAQDSFSLLSQPSVSKTCSFINSCIHPSLFWALGKIFTVFTHQVYTHFFFKNWLWLVNLFSKKSWKLFLFKSMLAFQLDNLFFFFSFFSFSIKLLSFVYFFFLRRSCGWGRTLPTHIKPQGKRKKHAMVSRNKNSDKITESHNVKF